MPLAYHLILSCYGFWLPNDPRGSWSDYVRNPTLQPFGNATQVHTHRSVAHRPHNHQLRLDAKHSLQFPPVQFTGQQARSVAVGFALRAARSHYRILACAIMPDHAHMVIAQHPTRIELISNQLKGAATRQLTRDNLHPLANFADKHGKTPSPWAVGQWKVFIQSERQLHHTIRYVQQNPINAGLKPQNWKFVQPPNP